MNDFQRRLNIVPVGSRRANGCPSLVVVTAASSRLIAETGTPRRLQDGVLHVWDVAEYSAVSLSVGSSGRLKP